MLGTVAPPHVQGPMINNLPASHAPYQPDMHEMDLETPVPMWLARHLTPKLKGRKSTIQYPSVKHPKRYHLRHHSTSQPRQWHLPFPMAYRELDHGLQRG